MSADLRGKLIEALTREHRRRAREQIVASPEEHCAGFADAAVPVIQAEIDRLNAEIERRRGEHIVSAVFAVRDGECPRPFALHRTTDETGVSGSGTVAYGVQFTDGTVVVRWLGEYASTVVWENLDKAMHVHGHRGSTKVIWLAEHFSDLADIETALQRLVDAARVVLAEADAERPLYAELDAAVRSVPQAALRRDQVSAEGGAP